MTELLNGSVMAGRGSRRQHGGLLERGLDCPQRHVSCASAIADAVQQLAEGIALAAKTLSP
jgi:hypothetical protein